MDTHTKPEPDNLDAQQPAFAENAAAAQSLWSRMNPDQPTPDFAEKAESAEALWRRLNPGLTLPAEEDGS